MKGTKGCTVLEEEVVSRIKKSMTKLHKRLSSLSDTALVKAIEALNNSDLVLLSEFEGSKPVLSTRYGRIKLRLDKKAKS